MLPIGGSKMPPGTGGPGGTCRIFRVPSDSEPEVDSDSATVRPLSGSGRHAPNLPLAASSFVVSQFEPRGRPASGLRPR